MDFDRAKMEDTYMKIKNVDMEHFPDTMEDLFLTASDLRTYGVQIYQVFTQNMYSEMPSMLRDACAYSEPQQFAEIEEKIRAAKTPEEKKEYEEVLADMEEIFVREGKKFCDGFSAIAGTVWEDSTIIEKNCRKDLTSGAFFYGKIEDSMRIRGSQIADMAEVIKNVYVEPMQKLKAQIKSHDADIDKYLDPNNAFERFMKALPSAEEFANLTKFAEEKADAKVQAMKAAYAVALKGIEYIGSKIVNFEKMEERRRLQEELDKLKQDYEKYKAQYKDVVGEYDKAHSLLIFMEDVKYFSDYAKPFNQRATECIGQLEKALTEKDAAVYNGCVKEMEKDYSVFWR
ncbi:MAG: hypothetical protein K2H37_03250 [Lachnospiraceae bacterium]|nr:hypothetical protein [Lachnospiraceae bacterium]